ncbi:MAG TPA: flagellar basal-body MS-ring/collar protein FliF [Bryobacteraceae bacterium]|jgi:flagellar M-ring protein FliF|nr:flagellar basal-body MS-ring/collar protein FliF [Bryobacteraceae bacterium]
MNQFAKVFKALSPGQRIGIAAVVLMLVAGIVSLVRWHHESDFRPLFTGMAAEDAATVVQKLKESGTEYRLDANGSEVLVPAAKVDELRLELAGAGLPRTGRIGFELFDKTNLGATDFTEHINYRRALEGELERSIRSLSEVEQARVHISFPKDSVFLDSREPAKASVVLTLRSGMRLSDNNILAVTNLVAGAVEGLSPEYVSVVDMRGNLLSRAKRATGDVSGSDDATLEYKHAVEKDLLAKVESTLSPLLGEDHFRVGISADCDFSTSEQTDETFDPSRSVMTSSQKSEDMSNRPDVSGVPGTASNLPRPTSRPVSTGASVSHRTENVNYETSRSVHKVLIPRGTIRRVTASVLLDNDVQIQGSGAKAKRVLVPPSPEKIKAIHELVAGIIGFTPNRGDQLVIEALPFQQTVEGDPGGVGSPLRTAPEKNDIRNLIKNPMLLIGAGVGVVLLIGLAFFAMTRKKKQEAEVRVTAALNAADKAEQTTEKPALPDADKPQIETKPHIPALPDIAVQVETLRENVRQTVSRDPSLAAGVIRSWIAQTETR